MGIARPRDALQRAAPLGPDRQLSVEPDGRDGGPCLLRAAGRLGAREQGVGLVVHDNYIVLDQLLRGRKAFTKKMKNAYDNLINAVEKLEKVVVHREPIVYETIFNDDPKCIKSKISLKL